MRYTIAVSVLFLFSSGSALGQGNPRHIALAPGITAVETLEQNWSDEESNKFYNAPQGSKLLPYDLFIHLERADSTDLFRSDTHIRELGFIPRKNSDDNPDGLPIGFIKDAPYNSEIAGLGITCAACHTGKITHGETVYLIDGAPTMGDFETFLRRLTNAIKETAQNDRKFERFAAKVIPENSSAQLRDSLRQFIHSVADEREKYNERNLPKGDQPIYGHGRVDAFGAIFNQVSAHFLGFPENAQPANAPVSYPCLWDAPQHDRVQWNGAAENRTSPLGDLFFGTNQVGALGRNAGEVLGVFGVVDINKHELLLPRQYESTVKKGNLIAIEESLMKLWSPKWLFPPVENQDEMRRRGRIVYNENCVSCHADITRDDPARMVTALIANVGTDATMLENFRRTAQTGHLKGRKKTILGLDRFQDEEPVGVILKHVVERSIMNSLSLRQIKEALKAAKDNDNDSLNPGYMNTAIVTIDAKDYRIPVSNLIEKAGSIEATSSAAKLLNFSEKLRNGAAGGSKFESIEDVRAVLGSVLKLENATDRDSAAVNVKNATAKFGYKARPLNGVWATAPYLHNGSVQNLTELLKVPDQRKTRFHVGSTVYDVENVGFVDDPAFPVFDTTAMGNARIGHNYGTSLKAEQKADLIEYLKSL